MKKMSFFVKTSYKLCTEISIEYFKTSYIILLLTTFLCFNCIIIQKNSYHTISKLFFWYVLVITELKNLLSLMNEIDKC